MISKSRLCLPSPQTDLIPRDDLDHHRESPIVLLSAGAGYGKSQLLYRWAGDLLASQDRTVVFGLCSRLGETASSLLELLYTVLGQGGRFRSEKPWQQQVDPFLELLFETGPVTIILDDIHHCESSLSDPQECRLLLSSLLDYRPPECQLILAGRQHPKLADLELRVMRGELTLLRSQDLALTAEHLEQLCPGLGHTLEVRTSGWPLAAAVLSKTPPEQWESKTEDLGEALLGLASMGLSEQSRNAVCVLALVGWASKLELEDENLWGELEKLAEDGVLVQRLDHERLGLHPIFSEQLASQANSKQRSLAIASLVRAGRNWEALERVEEPQQLMEMLLRTGEELLKSERWRLLGQLLERSASHPTLTRWRGEIAWRLGDPSSAVQAFHEAAKQASAEQRPELEAKSWRSAAQLYLDAVSPLDAQVYLKKAYRALPSTLRSEKAQLLELFAENALNQGLGRQAQRYRRLAARWDRHTEEDLAFTARHMLRSGKLAEARNLLEVAIERGLTQENHPAMLDGHKDPRLVLSYLAVLEGQAERAQSLAQEVLEQAQALNDSRTEAVAQTRLAHSRLIEGAVPEESVLHVYSQADSLWRTLSVERLRAEGLMGQALYYIRRENVPRAYQAAREGVEVSRAGGDFWMQAWLEFVQALAALQGEHPGAKDLLEDARARFKECRDRFGFALCEVWLALRHPHLEPAVHAGLKKAIEEFPFLLKTNNLFGPEPERLKSFLQSSKTAGEYLETPQRLQVFCLGPLSLLRDGQPIPAKAFKRKKARELLAILLSSPDSFFHREDLAATLWPDSTQKAALRDFRVALHALSDALDPDRPKNSSAFCIDRQEERYRLLSERMDLDAKRFEALAHPVQERTEQELERALKLYRGPFCEDFPYLESLEPVRRQFDLLFYTAAQSLAEKLLDQEQPEKAVEIAQRILASDPTWEPAYRVLMRGQAAQGHDHLIPRTFTLCLETLEQELGVEPSEETFAVARELLGEQLATIL